MDQGKTVPYKKSLFNTLNKVCYVKIRKNICNRVNELVTKCLYESEMNKTEVLEAILYLSNSNGQIIVQ